MVGPIVTGTLSVVWGLGFVGIMGYDFDPVMLVIPVILTAREMSHDIQWQGRYHDELDRLSDKYAACAATTDFMLAPGFLSIMAAVGGAIGGGQGLISGAGRGQGRADQQANEQMGALALPSTEVRCDFTVSGYVFFPKGDYKPAGR